MVKQACIAEFIEDGLINLTHFDDESYRRKQDAVVAIRKEVLGFGDEMVIQIRDLL